LEIRNIIAKYYYIEYQSEILGPKDFNNKYSVDERLISHTKNGEQIWVLGIIDNLSKDFRLDLSLNRNQQILKKYILKKIFIYYYEFFFIIFLAHFQFILKNSELINIENKKIQINY